MNMTFLTFAFFAVCLFAGAADANPPSEDRLWRRRPSKWVRDANGGVPYEVSVAKGETVVFPVKLSTDREYSIFGSGDEAVVFRAQFVNRSGSFRNAKVVCIVRDWDGRVVLDRTHAIPLDADAAKELRWSFDPPEERGIYFAEVSLRDAKTRTELAFARTNLARLPPYRFRSKPGNSIFGIAAYWPIPSEEAAQRLMDRLGVMWVRGGDTRLQHPPRVANHHSQVPDKITDETSRRAWLKKEFSTCRERKCRYWEFGNELNMSTIGIAMEGGGIGKALEAPRYAEWVELAEKVRREEGYDDIRILSMGIAGFDQVFYRRMSELGIWGVFDGICLHPGRGNVTPDYPFSRPENAFSTETGGFWNYLGSVRGCGKLVKELGSKPIWLTEVYTPTFPNSGWEDSLRDAADNVILTYALALAEGVKCAMYYQLFDGVWWDRCGVNHKDREFHFGLMNSDLSPKPSFMAYCAIAEALDGARFTGWAENLPYSTSHGLLFETPSGRTAVLWDRSEEYILTHYKADEPFRSPEPWMRKWKKTVSVPWRTEKCVFVTDAIGRTRTLTPSGGRVELHLDGSPLIVRETR